MMPIIGLKFRSADTTPAKKTRPKIDFHSIIDSISVVMVRFIAGFVCKLVYF